MSMEPDEERALLEELAAAEHEAMHPRDYQSERCSDCGFLFEADDRPSPLRDGLCEACWKAADEWRRRSDSKRLPRVVELGHWHEARFEYWPDRTLVVYRAETAVPLRLPFFDPYGWTDVELIETLRLWVAVS